MLMNVLKKAGIQGIYTAVAFKLFNGSFNSVYMFGMDFSLLTAGFVVGAVSSVVSDTLHSYVYSEIPVKDKYNDMMALGLNSVLAGAVFLGVLYGINPVIPQSAGLIKTFGIGAMGELVSAYSMTMMNDDSGMSLY